MIETFNKEVEYFARFCGYCGKRLTPELDYYGQNAIVARLEEPTYACDCENAKKEIELIEAICRLRRENEYKEEEVK